MGTHEHPSVSAGVQGRARTGQRLPANPDEALEIATAIEHPWYRCQALSSVAEVVPEPEARRIVAKALRAAHEQAEPNRIVTVASWPIRAMVSRRLPGVDEEVTHLLEVIETEPHSLRRAHALLALFRSVYTSRPLRDRVLAALIASLHASRGWRAERVWAAIVWQMREYENPRGGQQIVEMMPEGREKRRLMRDAAAPR